jgi:hypothetical protein
MPRLHKESAAILRLPESRERIAGDGDEVVASSPDEFAAFTRAETVKWAKVAKAMIGVISLVMYA